jgi:hypothetical protein
MKPSVVLQMPEAMRGPVSPSGDVVGAWESGGLLEFRGAECQLAAENPYGLYRECPSTAEQQ